MIPRPATLKLIAIITISVFLAGLVSYSSWSIATSRTEARERREADRRVMTAQIEAQNRFEEQLALTRHYRDLAEEKFGELLEAVNNIKVEHTTITRNITVERESNPEFYETTVPEGGIREWEAARQLLR